MHSPQREGRRAGKSVISNANVCANRPSSLSLLLSFQRLTKLIGASFLGYELHANDQLREIQSKTLEIQ